MDRYDLSKEEAAVYETVKEALKGLPTASQYNVLRNVAHAMDRELVRPGATRAAAAVAGSTARARADSAGVRKSSASPKNQKAPEGYPPEFLNAHQDLVDRQRAAKQTLEAAGNNVTDGMKAALRAASKDLRVAYESFRSRGNEN